MRPDAPLVYTYSSPSAEPFLDRLPVDLVLPLPLDGRPEMRSLFEALRPAALALVDAELWPGLLLEAERRDVPAALVAGRLARRSRRLAGPARPLYRGLLRTLRLVAAVDEPAADAFRAAGAAPARVAVTGDPRVDEVLAEARAAGAPAGAPAPPALGDPGPGDPVGPPVLVAGSTWPDDEVVLLPALAGLRRDGIPFRIVLAPHGTDEARLRDAERRLDAHGFPHRRWSRGGEDPPRDDRGGVRVLLVDRVGLLRSLYGGAAVAWVGGGFRGELHNVMEPAARGVAVVTGPRTERSWVADPLERAGGLVRVDTAERAGAALARLLGDGRAAALAGRRAREVLEARAGATRATVAALERAGWLPQPAAGAVSAR